MSSYYRQHDRIDFQELGTKFYSRVWKLFVKKFGYEPVCLDCGHGLPKNGAIIFLDWSGGMLFYCEKCTITRMNIKESWRRLVPYRDGDK